HRGRARAAAGAQRALDHVHRDHRRPAGAHPRGGSMTTDPTRRGTAAHAPHVEEDWADAFVLELRLLDVHGTVIGDALAEVDSHCADSGEGARETFGDPVEYARSLDLPRMPDTGWRGMVPVLVPVGVQLAGMFAVSASAGPLRHGEGVEVTAGQAVGAV